jgi:GNAT superfamily N-acetyltransferase
VSSAEGHTITIVDARSDDASLISAYYREVMLSSFRPAELDSEENIVVALRDGHGRVLIARDAGGTILGGAVGEFFPAARVMLLSYLATRQGARGGGVGSALLRTAITQWTGDFDPRLIVLEVEDPRYFTASDAYGDPVARARFYERFGARALPIPYVMPSLTPSTPRVPRLMLMVIGGADAGPAAGRVDGQVVADFLAAYYRSSEGPADPGDAELTGLLAACRRPDGLPLVAVGDLPPFEELG